MSHKKNGEIGFVWWHVWGWLGLTLGNLQIVYFTSDHANLQLTLILINSIIMGFVVSIKKFGQLGKLAFLTSTIYSLNPIIWLINGVYLKRRWNHAMLNADRLDEATSNKLLLERRMKESRKRMRK